MTARRIRSMRLEPLDRLYLVDNSADDAEYRRLARAVESIAHEGVSYQIELIRNERNLGFGRTINRVISADQRNEQGADSYLLLNNDTVVAPGLVAALVSAFDEHPNSVLAAPEIVTNGSSACYRWYNRWLGHVSEKPFPLSFGYLTGCCLLVSASLIEHGKLFDEAFFMYGEDIWLNWQAERKGGVAVCVQDASVNHEVAGSSRKGESFYEYHLNRGHVLLAWKIARGPWEVPFLVAGRLLYLPLRAILRSLRYKSWTPLQMLMRACAGFTPK